MWYRIFQYRDDENDDVVDGINNINLTEEIPQGFYNVEEILESRITTHNRRQRKEYKVKWLGFPVEEATWEPYNNLTVNTGVLDMLIEFELR